MLPPFGQGLSRALRQPGFPNRRGLGQNARTYSCTIFTALDLLVSQEHSTRATRVDKDSSRTPGRQYEKLDVTLCRTVDTIARPSTWAHFQRSENGSLIFIKCESCVSAHARIAYAQPTFNNVALLSFPMTERALEAESNEDHRMGAPSSHQS